MLTANAFDLTNRNAIVTGGAMGIGFAIVRRFLLAGARVLMADRDAEALRRAATSLDAPPGRVATLACDVGDDDTGPRLTEACLEAFGSVDILVNNAGVFPQQPVLRMDMRLFDDVIRTNLRGLVAISRAVGLQLAKQGQGGRIINIGSIDSFHPSMVGLGAYDTSKGGVLMFTKSFALEMAPLGVRVNMIAPGAIDTEGARKPIAASGLSGDAADEAMKRFAARIPLGRIGAPDDVARAAQFLASAASEHITGISLVVDGGTLLT